MRAGEEEQVQRAGRRGGSPGPPRPAPAGTGPSPAPVLPAAPFAGDLPFGDLRHSRRPGGGLRERIASVYSGRAGNTPVLVAPPYRDTGPGFTPNDLGDGREEAF